MLKHFLIISLLIVASSFKIPPEIQRRADKEISKFYEIEVFEKEAIDISEELNGLTKSEFGEENFFKIKAGEKFLGYGYIGNAMSKAASFDYLVLFDHEFIITKSKVLVYREEYGGEITSKRWLRQFTGKSIRSQELIENKDIIPISGATISVRAMTQAINNLLESLLLLEQKNIF